MSLLSECRLCRTNCPCMWPSMEGTWWRNQKGKLESLWNKPTPSKLYPFIWPFKCFYHRNNSRQTQTQTHVRSKNSGGIRNSPKQMWPWQGFKRGHGCICQNRHMGPRTPHYGHTGLKTFECGVFLQGGGGPTLLGLILFVIDVTACYHMWFPWLLPFKYSLS